MFARVAAEADAREDRPKTGDRPAPARRRLLILAAATLVLAVTAVALRLQTPPTPQHPADIKQSYLDILPMTSLDALNGHGWIVHAAPGWLGLSDRGTAQSACRELTRRRTPGRTQRLSRPTCGWPDRFRSDGPRWTPPSRSRT